MARTEKEKKKNPLHAASDLISLKPRQWWQSKAGVPMEFPPGILLQSRSFSGRKGRAQSTSSVRSLGWTARELLGVYLQIGLRGAPSELPSPPSELNRM